VRVKPGVLGQPPLDACVFVGPVVVQDHVHCQSLGYLGIDRAEKFQELGVAGRGRQRPITVPVSTSSVANRVVVP